MLVLKGVNMKHTFLGALFIVGLTLIILGVIQTFLYTQSGNEYRESNQEHSSELRQATPTAVEQARQGLLNRGIDSSNLATDEILELWEKMNNDNVTFIYSD